MKRSVRAGFTLVEMMVVLAIISIITTIALFGQSDFNRSVLLTDTAYTVALSLREMQSLGLSSRKTATGVQNAGYGAYFATANQGSYLLFGDTTPVNPVPANCLVGTANTPEAKPGDCIYTPGSDVIVQTYTFGRGFMISKICGYDSAAGVKRCSDDPVAPLSALNVVFLRSTTESTVVGYNGSWRPLTSAEVYIASADALGTRAICISRVGQISVTYGNCP